MHDREVSVIALKDPVEHAQRRKAWNRAFNTNAVKEYETGVQKRALQLMQELEKRAKPGETVNLSGWMKSFTCVFQLFV